MLRSFLDNKNIEAGCDEVGRGPLAGPVVAAAVILPKDFYHPLLNDSKQLTAKRRALLAPIIRAQAIGIGMGEASVEEIDRINILEATFLAMHRAIDALCRQDLVPATLLIDGNRFKPYGHIGHHCIVKGDTIFASIAAASILAKNKRDDYMVSLAENYPHYGWHTNMGYPTTIHRKAIAMHGLTPHHRKTFASKFLHTNPNPTLPLT